jgi:PAS domain S-box-containing protein
MSNKSSAAIRQFHRLQNRLIHELSDVYDAHFVCATIASEVAASTAVTTLVGLSDPLRQHYDIWIAKDDGTLTQHRWPTAKASLEPFLEGGDPIRLEKISQPVSEIVNSELWLLPKEDLLAVNLTHGNSEDQVSPPGVLCLIDPGDSCPLDSHNLGDLAQTLSVYLDRAHLRLRIDQQAVEFAVISDISHTLTSTLKMEDVFQQLTSTIRRTLHVESLSIGLSEPFTGDIVFVQQLMGAKFENLPEIRVKQGQGIAGWVALHGESVIINNVYADKRFYSGVDRRSGFRTNSMICIPLLVERRTIGVLQAINRQHGDFTEHDLQLLKAIGGPLAAAIENARLHAEVLSEKRRVETIFSSMSEGLLTVTPDGVITHTNDALAALLLTDPTELVHKNLSSVTISSTDSLSDLLETSSNSEDEYGQLATNVERSDGERIPVLISSAAIRDKNEEVSEVILTFSDLSQIREVERMREDLFQAIAHELRTPLATILMYARLLREGKARDEEKASRFLGVIERESDRLQRMVRRMMQLAKQESSELQRSAQPVFLNPLLAELLSPLADQAIEKGLLFRQRIEPDLPPILGDSEQLEEIFGNLVVNAIKFTPSGSVTVEAKEQDNRIIVEIRDQGIGIPKEAIPNLFKRFYRAQTAVERGIAGTGLGLYMVKQNVENYNGTINVTSSQDEGATFIVSFPVYQE